MARPCIFVGSSREGRPYADAIAHHLSRIAHVNLWSQAFVPNHGYFDTLIKTLEKNEFGVFVLTKDDELQTRSEMVNVSRDNVLFEYGLYLGKLGRKRSFAVVEDGVKLASDLIGVELPRFVAPAKVTDAKSALEPACTAIIKLIQGEVGKLRNDFLGFFGEGSLDCEKPYVAVFWDASLPSTTNHKYCDLEFGNLPVHIKKLNPLPKGVGHVIPPVEAQILLDLAGAFAKFGGSVQFRIDSYDGKPLPVPGCLSVGLGFSSLTRKLGEISGLYKVRFQEVDGRFTDTFHLIDGEHEIHPEEENRRYAEAEQEFALVARILNEQGDCLAPYLVCAGHTAAGTAVACDYICKHWPKLWGKYEEKLRTHHMACILNHKKDITDTYPEPRRIYFRRVRPSKAGIAKYSKSAGPCLKMQARKRENKNLIGH